MTFLLAPDSFKGTLSSIEVCACMERALLRVFPAARVVAIPVADGGEGTVDAFLRALPGMRVEKTVQGPFGEPVRAAYGIVEAGNTAVIEMAACAGLPLAGERKNPLLTTTFGVGQLMADALERGCRKIVLGLGGSATHDLGCGCLAALGARFFDAQGREFVPTGGTLARLSRVDCTGLHAGLAGCEITAMCDVESSLCGPSGAAYVFAPQKGADADMVQALDGASRLAAERIEACAGRAAMDTPGAGAAGGMGFGLMALLGAQLRRGIEIVLDMAGFDALLLEAGLVFTGEGRLDGQSLKGKVISGVARRASEKQVPVIAVVGSVGEGADAVYDHGVTAVFPTCRQAQPFEVIRAYAKENLEATMDDVANLLALEL